MSRFSCTQCGDCCFDQEVWLEPWDLLGLRGEGTTRALFAEGIIAMHDTRCRLMPLTRRMFGAKACRFVLPQFDAHDRCNGFGCQLHGTEAKPFVCRSAPVARRRGAVQFEIVAPVEGCPGMDQGEEQSPLQLLQEAGVSAERLARSFWFQDTLVLRDAAHAQTLFDFDAAGRIADATALDAFLGRPAILGA